LRLRSWARSRYEDRERARVIDQGFEPQIDVKTVADIFLYPEEDSGNAGRTVALDDFIDEPKAPSRPVDSAQSLGEGALARLLT
jgi:hypothetical protein